MSISTHNSNEYALKFNQWSFERQVVWNEDSNDFYVKRVNDMNMFWFKCKSMFKRCEHRFWKEKREGFGKKKEFWKAYKGLSKKCQHLSKLSQNNWKNFVAAGQTSEPCQKCTLCFRVWKLRILDVFHRPSDVWTLPKMHYVHLSVKSKNFRCLS